MAATIKDIAKKTGLGYATISAYLNNVNVRPKNKIAIEKAIDELGYVRNEYARGLKLRQTMTIGVLIPEFASAFSTAIISEMEDVLREKGYGIIVCDCRTDSEIEKKSLNFLISKMVDGLIVMPIFTDGKLLEPAINRNIPTVVIDRLTAQNEASYIIINNREVSENAVTELIRRGHKRIALITGDISIYTAFERRMGYKAAMESVGSYDESLIYCGNLSIEGGFLAAKQIISEHPDVTALFVTNYEMSVGAIIAIKESGKKIPDNLNFIGFDYHELSMVFSPKLTTVNQPLKEIGRKSAEEIMRLINGGKPKTTILNAKIESGDSVK